MSNKIKEAHERLNKQDKFSAREERGLEKRDKSFIRDIQIIYKVDKDSAIKIYSGAVLQSKQALKKLGKEVRKGLKKFDRRGTSGGGKVKENITRTRLKESPKITQGKNKGKQKGLTKEVRAYLENPKNQKEKTYARIKKASEKYPYATKYELAHGYNSVASKKYRKNIETKRLKSAANKAKSNTIQKNKSKQSPRKSTKPTKT
jgi:hypothetical protein